MINDESGIGQWGMMNEVLDVEEWWMRFWTMGYDKWGIGQWGMMNEVLDNVE